MSQTPDTLRAIVEVANSMRVIRDDNYVRVWTWQLPASYRETIDNIPSERHNIINNELEGK